MALFAVIVMFLVLAGAFAWYLVKRDQGEHEPIGALWAAFGFGCSGLLVAAALELFLLPDIMVPGGLGLGTLAWVSLSIGVIEELCKCLPLAVWLYHKRYFNEHTDGVIYFALAGLGFGLPENILYTFQFGAETGAARLMLTPLFHAATTGLIGYAIVRRKLDKGSRASVIGALLAVIGIHALYDFGLFSQQPVLVLFSVMITLGLAAGLFLMYLHARGRDQELGLSAVGHNSFCRNCGHPNPKHNLYCSSCGVRA